MIKINKSIIVIISLSLFLFIGYNVLTAEAVKEKDCSAIDEPDDDFYCKEFDWGAFSPDKQSVDELCDASEDYAKNPKNCDIAYGLVEKQDKNLKKDLGEACDKAGGKMVNGFCDVEDKKIVNKDGRNTVNAEEEIAEKVATSPDDDYQKYLEQKTQQPVITDPEPLTGYDEDGKQLNVVNGDYDEDEAEEADSSEESNDDIADYNNEAEFEEEDIDDDSSENDESEEQDEDESSGEEESDDSEDSEEEESSEE